MLWKFVEVAEHTYTLDGGNEIVIFQTAELQR